MLWHVDSAAAFECKGYELESSLAVHLDKGNVHVRGGLVCECTVEWCSVVVQIFFNLWLKLTNQIESQV